MSIEQQDHNRDGDQNVNSQLALRKLTEAHPAVCWYICVLGYSD